MRTNSHPIEPEELMAYLDGELPPARASRAAEHLGECRDCQLLAAELRGVSDRLMEWRVEAPVLVAPAGRVHPEKHEKPWYLGWKAWAVAAGLALATLFLQAPKYNLQFDAARTRRPAPLPAAEPQESGYYGTRLKAQFGTAFKTRVANDPAEGPLVTHTATLSLVATNFDSARTALDQILKRHKGYIAELTINAAAQSARTLNASLRAPDPQLDATISELKALGRVLIESRTGEEVTQQSIDLDARLANARYAEQRLIELLKNRTGKLSDVLEVETQITAMRGQIEQMEAERKNLDRRIQYARIDLSLTETYQPRAEHGPLRNAAVRGYKALADSLTGTAELVLSGGPVVLFWGAILALPAWYVWRRYRR